METETKKPSRLKAAGNNVLWFFNQIGLGIAAAAKGIWSALTTIVVAIWSAITAVFVAIGRAIAYAAKGFWRALKWLFEGVRPLRISAFVFVMIVGCALVYINTLGAWERTHDEGYAAIIFGIEGVVLVALPIIFAVRGWFTTPVAIAIFLSGIAIASFNAKPALENILAEDGVAVDPAEMIASAEKLEEEVFGFIDPDSDADNPVRVEGSGLLAQVQRMENDASAARTENGYVTASTRVDANAAEMRVQISEKLRQAEEYRAKARDSEWASQLAIITFVVAELIRSFGLKVLVGFDPEGTGREKKRKPKYRRAGLLRHLKDWFWHSIVGDPGYERKYADDPAKAGWETRRQNERKADRRLKVQENLSAYIKPFRTAIKKKQNQPGRSPTAIAELDFNMASAERLDDVLRQMVKAELIDQDDRDFLMDRKPPVPANPTKKHTVDIIDPYDETQQLNGTEGPIDDDVSDDRERPNA